MVDGRDEPDPMAIPAALVESDLPYLPLPNRVDLVLARALAPAALTRTAFLLPFLPDGTLLMARNRRRGVEVPGGHIDPGEDALAAAIREALEETGCETDEPVPLGFLRMVSEGVPPEGWRYPHPVGFQQFFAARVTRRSDYVENDECLAPAAFPPGIDALGELRLSGAHRAFRAEAEALLFPSPRPGPR